MLYYLIRQLDSEDADGTTYHEGYEVFEMTKLMTQYVFDREVDFIIYVAM